MERLMIGSRRFIQHGKPAELRRLPQYTSNIEPVKLGELEKSSVHHHPAW